MASAMQQMRAGSAVPAASAGPAMAGLTAPTFSEVKFQKEDVNAVMTELPDFNFYEMKEPVPNPYKGLTLDRSIIINPVAPALKPPQTSFSKLENGLKIASVDRQGLTASVGLFVNAGSRFESSANFGVSHMVEIMAFKSTAHLSHLRTVKVLEQLGANLGSSCKAGREDIVYQVDVPREFVPLVVPLLVGNVLFPRLLPWEIKAAHSKVKEARAALEANPDAMVSELLHKAAYCNNTLGYSPLASERSMSYFTPEVIRSFMLDHFAPERMVLVGVNVAHDDLSKWAMRSFADYNAIPLKARTPAKAQYTGGDSRVEGSSAYCHLAIAVESVPWGQADLAPVTLMQAMLGSASAVDTGISAGGGKAGQLVKQGGYIESCSGFNTSYSDSGLFGMYGVCHSEKAAELTKSMTQCLTSLKTVTPEDLQVAKAALKGSLSRQVDDSASLMKDLGSQLLVSGKFGSASAIAKAIDGVTAEQVSAAAKKMLQSKPTIAACGDTHSVPHYSAIEAQLKA